MDPALQVTCPNCKADVGVKCKRPSGHTVWNSWGRGIHRVRDLKALEEGKYGSCPQGKCPESLAELESDVGVGQTGLKQFG